jgi:hypothetical protein
VFHIYSLPIYICSNVVEGQARIASLHAAVRAAVVPSSPRDVNHQIGHIVAPAKVGLFVFIGDSVKEWILSRADDLEVQE